MGSETVSYPDVDERLTGVRGKEELDPELLELPDPPRGDRTLTLLLLAVTAVASVAMSLFLLRDAAYAFASRDAAPLGELFTAAPATAGPGGASGHNRLVSAHGLLGATGAIRYERPFEPDSYRLAPVAGRDDLWVELRVPAGAEGARFVPPSQFYGRLVRFDAVGPKHRALRARVPEGAWLIVDGETPERSRWAVFLVALFAGFAVWNVAAFVRLARKVR